MRKLHADGIWGARREILGWVAGGLKRAAELRPRKAGKALHALKGLRRQKQCTVRGLQKIPGKLQFAPIAIPAGKPLLGKTGAIIAKAPARSSRASTSKIRIAMSALA